MSLISEIANTLSEGGSISYHPEEDGSEIVISSVLAPNGGSRIKVEIAGSAGAILTDRDVAALATLIATSWTNS